MAHKKIEINEETADEAVSDVAEAEELEVEAEVLEDEPAEKPAEAEDVDADESEDDVEDGDESDDDGDEDADDEDEDDKLEGDEPEGEGAPNIFEAITAEVTELRDRYARLQAEWDNYRKRTAAERDAERVRASEKLATDLLPILDDLERAIAHAKGSGEGGSLTEGVEAIQGKFLQILEKHQVKQIEAQGEPFDAMQHQAVGTQENEDVPEETVVQVYQQGYTMGDRVIRPAMVVTSTGGPTRESVEPDEADEGDEE